MHCSPLECYYYLEIRKGWQCQACRPWGCRGCNGTPRFWQISYPISTKGGRLCPPNNTGTPGFSDLPTALLCKADVVKLTTFDLRIILIPNLPLWFLKCRCLFNANKIGMIIFGGKSDLILSMKCKRQSEFFLYIFRCPPFLLFSSG